MFIIIIIINLLAVNDLSIEQKQTILNLYNSGIMSEVIALQMDMNEEDVLRVIKEETKVKKEERQKSPLYRHR